MTTSADGNDIHPVPSVTVKLYVAAASPVIVLLIPEPVIVPGLIVQLPAGKPFNITLPVTTPQVGWVTEPSNGVEGAPGAVMVTFTPAPEVQPPAVIVRLLYTPAGAVTEAVPELTFTLVKVPVAYVIVYVPFGTLVNVKLMLPFAPQVAGLLPIAVSVGAEGAVSVTLTPTAEVQVPDVIVRLLYVPAGAETEAVPAVTFTLVKLPVAYVIVYVPFGTLVNVKLMLPFAPHVAGLLPVAVSVGAEGAVSVTLTPAAEVQVPDVIVRLLYVPAGAETEAVPAVTFTLVKLPVAYVIVYVPFGTFVKVKSILPLAPQLVAFVPIVARVGAPGAVMVTFTPAPEVQPADVTDRLLYAPGGTIMVAVPLATVTPVKLPPSYDIVYDPFGVFVKVKSILPLAPQVAALVPKAASVGAPGAVIATFMPVLEVHPAIVVIVRLL
jgi:hypothetical protein